MSMDDDLNAKFSAGVENMRNDVLEEMALLCGEYIQQGISPDEATALANKSAQISSAISDVVIEKLRDMGYSFALSPDPWYIGIGAARLLYIEITSSLRQAIELRDRLKP
jgi:hypothetical protein